MQKLLIILFAILFEMAEAHNSDQSWADTNMNSDTGDNFKISDKKTCSPNSGTETFLFNPWDL